VKDESTFAGERGSPKSLARNARAAIMANVTGSVRSFEELFSKVLAENG